MQRLFLIAAMFSCGLWSQAGADQLAESLAEELLSRTSAPGVGVAYALGDDTGIAVAGVRAVGEAVPIELADLWHIGSNTKSMTATLVARLAESGSIDWDDRVGDVLSDRLPEIHPAFQEVTYHELLDHRAGLVANIDAEQSLSLAGTLEDREVVADRMGYAAMVLSQEPVFPPGEGYLYSNAGYVVAGTMLEVSTGLSWEDLMRQEVFDRLGLASAGFGPPGTIGSLSQPRGHAGTLSTGLAPMEPDQWADNVPALGPAGTVHMNLADLLTFLTAHLDEPATYLSDESWQMLHRPEGDASYRAGWITPPGGLLVHTGSNTFWYLLVAVWPERDAVLVLACNYGDIAFLDPEFGAVAARFFERS
ncbi:MAG: serine hydrolase domain-containing protein [Pseudomonadota bacterium]